MARATTVAHVSDWHATTLAGASARELATKRFFGWLSWLRKRRFVHRRDVLHRLFDDVRERAPDTVVVTGDLTNVALPSEFEEAVQSLRALGPPDRVFVVPGNHDAYVPVHGSRGWDHWADYLRADGSPAGNAGGKAPSFDEFPTVRVRSGVGFVGLCSALPTGLFRATGRLGQTQIERAERELLALRSRGLTRVVLVHHPVSEGAVSRRRALRDAAALRDAIGRVGADLVLHGHTHRAFHDTLPGPDGPVPVAGVRSSSDASERPERRAQYHWFQIEPGPSGGGARIELEVRGLGADGRVDAVERRILAPGG